VNASPRPPATPGRTAPCQAACPIGTEAWRYVAHLARGEYEQAYQAIREANPFPSVCARVCDHLCESRCRLGGSGNRPVAIRALKRFVTDRIDPASFKPQRQTLPGGAAVKVAVVGSGPAGLTCAHYLSLRGFKVTVFEAEDELGGMLIAGIPEYRLPHKILKQEIASLLDDNITVRASRALGRDFTIDDLFAEGYRAVFLGLGAHRSRKLGIEGEDAKGVHPAMPFLRAWNRKGTKLARGHVGVIGGGNSAIDAARVALRQPGVTSVTLFYRRSREEMPAFPSEIEAALEEGVKRQPRVSPARILTTGGRVSSVVFTRNTLGKLDASGRRSFSALPGSDHEVPLDTVVAAIGEQLHTYGSMDHEGLGATKQGTLVAEAETLLTPRPGVFAGSDVVTGPSSVVGAIAAGKRAATMIYRHIFGEPLKQPALVTQPTHFVEPLEISAEELDAIRRSDPPVIALKDRRTSFAEVELGFKEEDARREARRCLRCDLEFTRRHKHAN